MKSFVWPGFSSGQVVMESRKMDEAAAEGIDIPGRAMKLAG